MSIRETLCAVAVPIMVIVGAGPQASEQEALRKVLTFHASFDGKIQAMHGDGDPALHWAPSLKERQDLIR